MSEIVLEVRRLRKDFHTKKGILKAVNDVSFAIPKAETLGLVGESGCGKTTTGRAVIRLLEATGGEILFEGNDIRKLDHKGLREMRKHMQIIFQDPFASLDPRLSVSETIREPLDIYGIGTAAERADKVAELMSLVGLAERLANSYPHELDGGRRQRVGVARALSLEPKFIVCDEPVSALDVSIQAQILNLIQDLQEKLGLTYLFISHDLSVVKHISRRIAVMYLGKIVEITKSAEIFKNPLHPYTKALLSAIPIPKVGMKRDRVILEGDVPSPINPPPGCIFAGRCKFAMPKCRERDPALTEVSESHEVKCFLYSDKEQGGAE
ncbi:ABC transporter ATP-binding protein [Breznakiella homolactica]|uniref:ATP-binding cassette domain-containing protein n=1 Tax=Breznakiella homolactica TaxID=2798577 RepID=A0A7T7XQ55_9SPIR|nr:oligopeptide/dipeptide ABC transporter ATP-binding protein [Breznakiella homolactica]QQO10436.1 ATP-binding cassette domain-containing protein [Breznakiella homolactica]